MSATLVPVWTLPRVDRQTGALSSYRQGVELELEYTRRRLGVLQGLQSRIAVAQARPGPTRLDLTLEDAVALQIALDEAVSTHRLLIAGPR